MGEKILPVGTTAMQRPKGGVRLAHSRNIKEASVAGLEKTEDGASLEMR